MAMVDGAGGGDSEAADDGLLSRISPLGLYSLKFKNWNISLKNLFFLAYLKN